MSRDSTPTRPTLDSPPEWDPIPRLLVLDVDGVLTDNRIYLDADGRETKAFHVPDGVGLRALDRTEVTVAIISGRRSAATEARARELGISECHTGVSDKIACLAGVLERTGRTEAETVFVGDDWADIGVMGRVGVPIAVADAEPAVLAVARHVTSREGGRGAVREVCEWLLAAHGAHPHP